MTRSRIDLLLLGEGVAPTWTAGATLHADATPRAVVEALAAWLDGDPGEAILLWDPALGVADPRLAAKLVAGRGDVWHAGLALGTAGLPAMIDFVAPNWMFTRDPPADREATSWRTTPRACLIRTEVLRQLGVPRPEFDTLAGAMLEWGHRAIARGAFLRHVPDLVATTSASAAPLPLADEVRFLVHRFGLFWTRWAIARAMLTSFAPASELLAALRALPDERTHAEPPPYVSGKSFGEPDLANAKVTVLIPTLDRYPYLHVMLEDLREQTVPPLEIIIIDQTVAANRDLTIAEKFADLPLKLIYQDEPGQCASRNAGLQVSRGDYVLFIDDDDEFGPTLIEDHLRNLARFDADVSSGVVQEVDGLPLAADKRFVRASDVFPTNNTLVRRDVLRRSGLFDLAFNRAPRADGELGMRVYLSGAFMVLDQRLSLLHHRAPQGGLRVHRARVVTYRSSREKLTHRHLPHISEIYLWSRHFSERQRRETLWLRTFGTLSGRGGAFTRVAKAMIGGLMLPDTLRQTAERARKAVEWLERFPQIDKLET